MSVNKLFLPYPVFPDIDGDPLESGYVYIGAVNTNPEIEGNRITAYWDEALQIPATQPIRTINGYLSRNGSPGNIYVDADSFSITIRDRRRRLVVTDLDAAWAVPFNSITGTSGSVLKINSMAALIAAQLSADSVYVESYYASWEDTNVGPRGGHFRHKTGATNTAPTVGAAQAVSTIGTGVQAGYCWDAAGEEWRISADSEVGILQFGGIGDYATTTTNNLAALNDAFYFATTNDLELDTGSVGDQYGFDGTLIIADDIKFKGQGKIIGITLTGSAPTRAALTGAANSAARLTLLQAYYSAYISLSKSVILRGQSYFQNALFTGSNYSITCYGHAIMSNVSYHAVEIKAQEGGSLSHVASSYSAISDASGTAIFVSDGYIKNQEAIIVYPGSRGAQVYGGGLIDITNAEIWNAGNAGTYTLFGGSIIATNATIDSSGISGVLTNYGGDIDINAATINNSGESGVTSESGGNIFAEAATITGNTNAGCFVVYQGMIQARNATITGNGTYACYANGSGLIDVSGTATIDNTNTGVSGQILRALGGGVIKMQTPGTGNLSTLSLSNCFPGYNTVGAGSAYIGLHSQDNTTFNIYSMKGPAAPPSVVIASGVATPLSTWSSVDTEGAAATDDLDDIDPTYTHLWFIRTTSSTRDVTLKHNVGGATNPILLNTGADKTLTTINEIIVLVYQASSGYWIEPE